MTDSIGAGSPPEEVRASRLAEVKRRRETLARGEETLVEFDDVMARLRAKVRRSVGARTLDASERCRYALCMSKAQAAEQPRPASDVADREAFMAAVEAGLADLKAGRVYTHEQVQAEMRKRFPPLTK